MAEDAALGSMIQQGAEAQLFLGELYGRQVVHKHRVPKSYRLEELDNQLRAFRTKREAKLLAEARLAGVKTPHILDIDVEEGRLTMEYIDGPAMKRVLYEVNEDERIGHVKRIGQLVAALHQNDIVHGDLTTSNMLLGADGIYFIDFSLGMKSEEVEQKGVDLHLLKEVWTSSHYEFMDDFEVLLGAYAEAYPDGKKVIGRIKDIEKRGRYT